MELLGVIFCIFVLPVLLIKTSFVPFTLRIALLVGVAICAFVYMYISGWTLAMLGFRTDTFAQLTPVYLTASVVGILGIKLYAYFIGRKWDLQMFVRDGHFLFGVIFLVAAVQQLLFYGFLFHYVQDTLQNSVITILLVSILFAFLHTIYPNPKINLPLAFCGGLLFASAVSFGTSFYLATMVHVVLNAMAVSHGFFVPEGDYKPK